MSIKVKLSEIIEGMDSQSDERLSYLNKETGELASIPDYEFRIAESGDPLEEYSEWQHDLIKIAKEILEDKENKFVSLPSRFDIDEYMMMEKFALSVKDDYVSNYLYAAIKGKKAFRKFKDGVLRFGMEKSWYKYRESEFKEIAIRWCEENKINYIDDL